MHRSGGGGGGGGGSDRDPMKDDIDLRSSMNDVAAVGLVVAVDDVAEAADVVVAAALDKEMERQFL